MRVYRERLGAPAWWWLVAAFCVLMMGSILWAGFSLWTGVAVYAVLGGGCAALFLIWGGAKIEVSAGEIRVGSRALPLPLTGQIAVLNQAQARELRGPSADPSAYLLIRPYLPRAIYIEVTGASRREPYWLIGTRRPAELAAAIERARPSAQRAPACDDVAGNDAPARMAGDRAAGDRAAGDRAAGEAAPGRESNAGKAT